MEGSISSVRANLPKIAVALAVGYCLHRWLRSRGR